MSTTGWIILANAFNVLTMGLMVFGEAKENEVAMYAARVTSLVALAVAFVALVHALQ